jgi:hypothetical protein
MKPSVKQLRFWPIRFWSIALAIAAILIFSGIASSLNMGWHSLSVQAQPAPLRRVNPTLLSAQIYEQLPNLPLENQYISSDTNSPAADNTLVSRIIRYHIYIQERPTNFRLDWKLTLADYLGAFERITADQYPDYGLRENPMEGDIAAVQSLSAEQRNQLVNALYEASTTNQPAEPAEP